MRRPSPAVWAAVLVGLVVVTGPRMVPALEISVRGEARLDLEVRMAGTTVEIAGRLVDDIGEPIPQQSVDVVLRRQGRPTGDEETFTDYYGLFSSIFELAPGTYKVEVEYEGASHVTASRAEKSFEVRDVPTNLVADVPAWAHGQTPEVPVDIRATADGVGIPTFVTLTVGDRAVASVDLDRRGRGRFDVGPYLEPGTNEVAVILEETEHREEVETRGAVRQSIDPKIEGSVERIFQRTERGRRIEVVVEDDQGPLADVDIEFRLEPTEDLIDGDSDDNGLVAFREADEEGRASVLFADEQLAERRWSVSAHIEPPAGETVVWQGEEFEQRAPIWPAIVRGIALLVLVAGLVWYGRRGLLLIRDRLRDRFFGKKSGESDGPPRSPVFDEVERLAVEPTEPSIDAQRRSPDVVAVELWDEWSDEPVETASVTVDNYDGDDQLLETDNKSCVEVPVADGTVDIRVEAPGFVPARAEIRPSKVSSRVRLELTPVPLKIRRAYRWLLEQTRGDDPWGRLTPREIEDLFRTLEPDSDGRAEKDRNVDSSRDWRRLFENWDELDERERGERLVETMTAVVEETNFSGRDFDVDVWKRTRVLLEALADRLERHRGGRR